MPDYDRAANGLRTGRRMTRDYRTWKAPTPVWIVLPEPEPVERLGRAKTGERPFGYELSLIVKGAFSKAVDLLYGLDARSRAEAEERGKKLRDATLKALADCKTTQTKRGVAALCVKLAALLEYTAGGHKAHGWRAFFGRQHDREKRSRSGKWAAYMPKELQGGLAEELGVCVRTLYRWWQVLVRHGVWHAWRPPRSAPDAILTKSGAQVYSQRMLVGGTPKAVLAGLPTLPDAKSSRPSKPDLTLGQAFRQSELSNAQAYVDGRDVPY